MASGTIRSTVGVYRSTVDQAAGTVRSDGADASPRAGYKRLPPTAAFTIDYVPAPIGTGSRRFFKLDYEKTDQSTCPRPPSLGMHVEERDSKGADPGERTGRDPCLGRRQPQGIDGGAWRCVREADRHEGSVQLRRLQRACQTDRRNAKGRHLPERCGELDGYCRE